MRASIRDKAFVNVPTASRSRRHRQAVHESDVAYVPPSPKRKGRSKQDSESGMDSDNMAESDEGKYWRAFLKIHRLAYKIGLLCMYCSLGIKIILSNVISNFDCFNYMYMYIQITSRAYNVSHECSQ